MNLPSPLDLVRRTVGFLQRRRLRALLVVALLLVLVGTLGYYFIEEKYDLFDALYMTVITLSTIG